MVEFKKACVMVFQVVITGVAISAVVWALWVIGIPVGHFVFFVLATTVATMSTVGCCLQAKGLWQALGRWYRARQVAK